MYLILDDNIEAALADAVREDPAYLNQLVEVKVSPRWPNQLVFEPSISRQMFYATYQEFLSRHLMLNEFFSLKYFIKQLEEDGFCPVFDPATKPLLDHYESLIAPMKIEGLTLRKADGTESELWEYQRYTLRRAIERAEAGAKGDQGMFFGWGAGAGKSASCAAGILELYNRDLIDVAFAFTLRKLKYNLRDFIASSTPLKVIVNDGTSAKRQKMLADESIDVYVNNPDKGKWDKEAMIARVEGKRAVFVFDEAQVVLAGEDGPTQVRQALEQIFAACAQPIVWPMSASVVNHSPFRYRDTFQLGRGQRQGNPLGSKTEFQQRYVDKVTTKKFKNKKTRRWFETTTYTWKLDELQDVRHHVAHCTQNARKTDPGVRENFKGLQVDAINVQLSDEDAKLMAALQEMGDEARQREENPAPYLMMARYICNAPAALGKTASDVGQRLARAYPKLVTNANSSKIEMFCDKVQSIYEAEDKVIAFTKWTDFTLHMVAEELARREIPHVKHWGTGMSDKAAYEAQVRFREDPGIPLFFSSDAGAYGLNMQMCRYVINYECPKTYDKVMQRNARIDRADSYLDGLTSYIYVTVDTIEEYFYRSMLEDQELVQATTGAQEVLSYGQDDDDGEDFTPAKMDAWSLLLGKR